jgi:MFS family permease
MPQHETAGMPQHETAGMPQHEAAGMPQHEAAGMPQHDSGGGSPAGVRPPTVMADLVEGLRFVVREPNVRLLIGLIIVMSLFGVSFMTLMPAWASRILGGDATTNGFLQSARGVGALGGALFLAWLGRRAARGRMLTRALFLAPVAVLVFSFIRWLPAALFFLAVSGVGLIVALNVTNSLLHSLAPDGLRGRVMSVYTLAFFGFVPLGGLLAGTLASWWGEPSVVALNAGISLVFAVLAQVLLSGIDRIH